MSYTNGLDDPSAYFQTALYTGAGSTVVTVTNDGNSDLQPDFLWFKRRDSAGGHALLDTSRGANVTSGFGPTGYSFVLNSNSTASEVADSTGVMTITSDGFTVKELTYAGGNTNTGSMVAWQWHCNGGTNSSNTDGSITSTVQANQDAGFSIGTFTGTGLAATIGHGLGVKPDMLILKSRNNPSGAAMYWMVAHVGLDGMAGTKNLFMNETWAADTSSAVWGNVAPTSSVFTVSTNAAVNYSGNNMLFYAFANKQGYSKFGSYVGNGNPNGPFIYTGFKPAFVLIKNVDATQVWIMYDGARKPFNRDDNVASIYASETNAEYTGASYHNLDILSNGFKIRLTDASQNGNGNKHIYMAFAENPFVTSTGIPTTAR